MVNTDSGGAELILWLLHQPFCGLRVTWSRVMNGKDFPRLMQENRNLST